MVTHGGVIQRGEKRLQLGRSYTFMKCWSFPWIRIYIHISSDSCTIVILTPWPFLPMVLCHTIFGRLAPCIKLSPLGMPPKVYPLVVIRGWKKMGKFLYCPIPFSFTLVPSVFIFVGACFQNGRGCFPHIFAGPVLIRMDPYLSHLLPVLMYMWYD